MERGSIDDCYDKLGFSTLFHNFIFLHRISSVLRGSGIRWFFWCRAVEERSLEAFACILTEILLKKCGGVNDNV